MTIIEIGPHLKDALDGFGLVFGLFAIAYMMRGK